MKKTACKALLSLLCAVMLFAGIVPTTAVSAEMGCDFPWTKEQTLLEKIIQRDGLLDGIWYPWINASQSGHNLTGNDVFAKFYGEHWAEVELDKYGAERIYQEIYNLKAMGYNMLAWAGSIYGEGVQFDDYGDVIGIKQDYLDNARRLHACHVERLFPLLLRRHVLRHGRLERGDPHAGRPHRGRPLCRKVCQALV